MSSGGLPEPLLRLALVNFMIDRVSGEIAQLFEDAGIPCLLVKGPVIAEWLYPDATRAYGDSDFLVPRADWDRAVAILTERGFSDQMSLLGHPRMESFASTGFVRDHENVDLHCTLPGLDIAPEGVWAPMWEAHDLLEVGGRPIAVPGRPGVLMHLALHAAHHHDAAKPMEDLRRGLDIASVAEWQRAAELASRLDGLPAFSSGLRRLPQGDAVATALGLREVGSVRNDLRLSGIPLAEALHQLLGPGLTWRQRASQLLSELFPKPSFMRWSTPVARRGTAGLVASYPLRWAWLALHLPRGVQELARARRRRA
jgi:hypothetical protein